MQAQTAGLYNYTEGDGNNTAMIIDNDISNGKNSTNIVIGLQPILPHSTTTASTTMQTIPLTHTSTNVNSTNINSDLMQPQSNAPSSNMSYSAATQRYRMEPAASSTATSITNRIVIPTIQGECGMETPLPRINDATFRQKWNNRQLSINCAVLFDSVKDARHVEYLEALCVCIEPTDIVSIGNAGDGKISIVFISTKVAEKVLLHGITLHGIFLQPTPFMSRPVRVVLSKIPAWVPDEPLLKYFKQFGKITSNIRPLPINSNKIEKFTNIISNFRELYINMDKNKKLPGHLQIIDGDDSFSVDITTEQKCYVCRETGHLARICPKKLTGHLQQEQLSTRSFPELRSTIQQQQRELLPPQQQLQPLAQSTQVLAQHNIHQTEIRPIIQQPAINQQQNNRHNPATDNLSDTFQFPEFTPMKRAAPKSSTPEISLAIKKQLLDDEDEDTASIGDSDSISDFEDDANLLKNITPDRMKKLLEETYHKKNKNKLVKIIKTYSKEPQLLIPDFRTYRSLVQSNSVKPANTLQRIDRLIEFVESL